MTAGTHDGRRLRGIALVLMRLADDLDAGRPVDAEHVDLAIAQLKGARVRTFGERRLVGSARERIRSYMIDNAGQEIPGDELAEVAGISEWARRVRELRAEGLEIHQSRPGHYKLQRPP